MLTVISIFALKRLVRKALLAGEIAPHPQILDFLYGNGDGDFDIQDILDLISGIL